MTLTLSDDEALVLFEFLSRFSDRAELTVVDQAEERVLWDVHSLLETQLVAPLDPDYRQLVAAARDRVRDAAT